MKLSEKNLCDALMECGDSVEIKSTIAHWADVLKNKGSGWEDIQQRLDYITKIYSSFEMDEVQKDVPICDSVVEFELYVANKYRQVHRSAKSRGKEFTLTLADVRRLIKRKTCAYTGVKFEKTGDNILTFERVNSDIGYTKQNVIAVSLFANKLKNALFEDKESKTLTTPQQLKKMLEVIENCDGGLK